MAAWYTHLLTHVRRPKNIMAGGAEEVLHLVDYGATSRIGHVYDKMRWDDACVC